VCTSVDSDQTCKPWNKN